MNKCFSADTQKVQTRKHSPKKNLCWTIISNNEIFFISCKPAFIGKRVYHNGPRSFLIVGKYFILHFILTIMTFVMDLLLYFCNDYFLFCSEKSITLFSNINFSYRIYIEYVRWYRTLRITLIYIVLTYRYSYLVLLWL